VLYGGATNLWGNTWTTADINSATFGAAFSAKRGPYNSTDTTFVDYIPITIDYTAPTFPVVASINTASTNPTAPATAVSWTVTFSAGVTGVDATDFALVPAGGVTGATITSVTGGGSTWTVNANSGSGTGTLGLNLVDNDTIVDGSGRALGGVGAGNGNFTGQVYTVAVPLASGIVNTYYPGTTASVAAGATSITLGAATGAGTPISAGDTLLIMQMQGTAINLTNTSAYGTVSSSNAGKYEYVIAANSVPVSGGTLNISCGTLNSYTSAAASGTSGQQTYQVIRVPVYASAVLTSTLTALDWNGSTGGVLAMDATGTLNLNSATVSVNGLGFRGGAARNETTGAGVNTDYRTPVSNLANGSKGEGIAGTPYNVLTSTNTLIPTGIEGYPNGSFARGAPANGGGGATDIHPSANDQNPGGGGGGNGGRGGQGGIGWCPGFTTTAPYYGCGISALVTSTNPGGSTGGIGANPVAGLGATQLTMGGGGGAGTTNNATGANGALSTSGVPGGGIIMLRAGSLSGSGTLTANGKSGDQTVANDGGGGAGAGGTVMVSAASGLGGLTVQANGGRGGSTLVPGLRTPNTTATPHGPGGGGGGGFIITSGAAATASAAGGSNGVSYNGGATTPFTDATGSYGSTPGSNGMVNSSLAAASIPGVALGSSVCGGPDHLVLQSSGSGLTCAANTLNVIACANAACSSLYTAGVTGTLSSTGTVSWDGGTGGAAGSGFVIPSGSSNVSKSMQVSTAGTVTLAVSTATPAPLNPTTICNFGNNPPANNNCVFTANSAGFIFSGSNTGNSYTIPSQISGKATPTLYLRALQASTTNPAVCTPAIIGQTTAVNMGYTCNNPVACQPGNLATINTTSIASGGTPVSLTFDGNGSAPVTARYDDAGQITLSASKVVTPFTGAAPVTLTGSSNAYIVKPDHFDLTAIQQTAAPNLVNPAATSATGAKFVKAGEPFSVTVTARNFANAATPNFGKEIVPESVKLAATLVAPAGGHNPPVGGTFGAFTGGVATGTNFTWDEVGIITLTPSILSGNYLTSAGGAGDTTGTISGNVGRFYAAQFALSSGVIANRTDIAACVASGCGNFTYMGERFDTRFTLTAQAVGGATTQNYSNANGFAKLNPAAVGNPLLFGAVNSTATPSYLTARLDTSLTATGSFTSGVATVIAPLAITHPITGCPNAPDCPDGPYTLLDIGIAPQDSDGALMAAYDLDTNAVAGNDHTRVARTEVRYGRINLSNAYGSELLPLPIDVTAQYWNGLNYVTSITDSLSSFAATNIVFSNYQPNLTAGNYPNSGATGVTPASVVLINGVASYLLAKPGISGSVDMNTNGPTYLPSNKARATFGVYKAPSEFIYRRENY
jgi:hypothetical protein